MDTPDTPDTPYTTLSRRRPVRQAHVEGWPEMDAGAMGRLFGKTPQGFKKWLRSKEVVGHLRMARAIGEHMGIGMEAVLEGMEEVEKAGIEAEVRRMNDERHK